MGQSRVEMVLMMKVSRFSGNTPFHYRQIGFEVHHPFNSHKCNGIKIGDEKLIEVYWAY